ncbi:Transcriptional adapter ada2 [Malassezia nana]|uniref:Transcriptional adapter 2 n=1 Tax=Malassezia nana TaxID=180528 RepID=A0AAF0EKR9_9BASI|nr:Transcriptional adapter ada2 [Malassezia nana]
MTVSHRKPRPVQSSQERSGSEIGQHKAWHDYRVIEQHCTPVFCPDWGVDEELLLIDGCQMYGVGNWMDIAAHIGNRNKEEVEQHFIDVYILGKNGLPSGEERAQRAVDEWRASHPPSPSFQGEERLPVVGPDPDFTTDKSPETFQRERRERIEHARAAQAAFVVPKASKPLVSGPTTHSELAGFMPGRLEFDHEYEQDAEQPVKDMEFGRVYAFGGDALPTELEALGTGATQGQTRMESSGRGGPMPVAPPSEKPEDETFTDALEGQAAPMAVEETTTQRAATTDSTDKAEETTDDRAPDWDEDPADLELKLAVLDIYNDHLDRRAWKKQFLFERNIIDYRRLVAAERRRPKEERDLLARIRHFATLQTAADFDELFHNLCYEEALKKTIRQLQQYRRMGITTFAEAAKYDRELAERTKRQLEAAEGHLSLHAATSSGRTRHRERSQSVADKGPDDEFSFASAPSIQLLTSDEQQLCAALHILPQPFLVLKAALLTYSYAHHRALTLQHCEQLCAIDPRKLAHVYDFFRDKGYLHMVRAASSGGGGTSKRA